MTLPASRISLWSDKTYISKRQWAETPLPDLADGQALLKIDRFSFTSNNVTYGVVGEMIGYWQFYPAEGNWGHIPVWAFATVVASRSDAAPEGMRVWGFFPIADYVVLEPQARPGGFVDAAAHRQALPAVYNGYNSPDSDPGYDNANEDIQNLFRPLFTTSFMIDDYLGVNDMFGADQVVLGSASSKTGLGAAYVLSRRADRPRIIGLTSPGNKAFVEGLGCYDDVVLYDDVASIAEIPTAFVDMAGNGQVIGALHNHLKDNLKVSSIVGATHYQNMGPPENLPGPQPSMFFAPALIAERTKDWGADGFQDRVGSAAKTFHAWAADWLQLQIGEGQDAVAAAYDEVASGKTPPNHGHLLTV